MATANQQQMDTELFRRTDLWGGHTACAAFITSHLTGRLTTPAEVDLVVGREPNDWADLTAVNYWLLEKGLTIEEYGDNDVQSYFLGEQSFDEMIRSQAGRRNISEATARAECNKVYLDTLKPTYLETKKKFDKFEAVGRLIEHNSYATPETVVAAAAVGKVALVWSQTNQTERGATSSSNVIYRQSGNTLLALSASKSGPVTQRVTDEYLHDWVNYSSPTLVIS